MRWLAKDPPNLEEARAAIELVIGSSHRVAKALARIQHIRPPMPTGDG
ncbi:MAG: hypothetical protein WAS21_18515 [Geminicoccaceae bacterium]